MVSRAWFTVFSVGLCLLMPFVSQAGVSVFPQKVMLGEPVILIITGDNIESDFEKVNKDSIRNSFEIFDVEGNSDRLRLTLYPRQTGQLSFPAIRQGRIQFNGTIIEVEKNPEVFIDWKAPPSQAYVQQFISWGTEVKVKDAAFEVTMNRHPHFNAALTHRFETMAVGQSQTLSGKTEMFVMGISSEKAGRFKVRSPMIRIKNSGQRPWLFFDETHFIEFKPIPSYLPAFMPIGEIKISAKPVSFWLEEDRLYEWELKLTGKNLFINTLPDLTQQLWGGNAIEWMTPEIKKEEAMTSEGVVSEMTFQQPFRVAKLGVYVLPDMRVTYFDPETGKLADQTLSGQVIVSVPAFVIWILQTMVLLMVVVLLLLIIVLLNQWLSKIRLLVKLNAAQNNQQIWRAILVWSNGNLASAPGNISFGRWQALIELQVRSDEKLVELVNTLNRVEFSQYNPELKSIAQKWANSLPNFHLKGFLPALRRLLIKFSQSIAVFFNRNH